MTGNTSQTSASSDNAPNTTTSDASANLNTDTIASSNQAPLVQRDLTSDSESNSARSSAVTEPRMNFQSGMTGTTSSNMAAPSASNVNNEVMTGMLNSMQSMQGTMLGLQQTVIKLININDRPVTVDDNNLSTAYAAMRNNDLGPRPSTSSGAESSQTSCWHDTGYVLLIYVMMKRIWEGKYVNLAALLIPKHEADKNIVQQQGSITVNLSNHEDTRLLKSLTISEFITAFGKYKRVMCSKFPNRRIELDRYEANIIDIYNVYGAKFYDYHCQFSARAAAALRDCNIKREKVDTPINVDELKQQLHNHPDKQFVNYLCHGLAFGFDTLISNTDVPTKECRNLRSAITQPDIVDKLIESEVNKGFLEGPFEELHFQQYRVSPIGVAIGKYSGKPRLIVDLSSPHENIVHQSVNDMIDKDSCSLSYVRIDDAIQIIQNLGRYTTMCKTDISDAFKLMPVLPSQWHMFCIKWRTNYYFYTKLAFGCRSSPRIFDNLSQAVCWIAKNNFGIEFILHLLDDFITFEHPHKF
ncbi:unnamed protein product [Mytilus edulis]|uniref:Reverse transcriptase domain-containing protein n=1 Tax=Mytilus edulis TaxID=6550 RepID=A0A8S3PS99_MYTED|nr:unnamed protein product [Mytilus edulis]